MPYREKKIYSGAMLEIERLHCTTCGRVIGRKAKSLPTGKAQKKINLKNAQLRLARLMCTNFKYRDFHLTLCFEELHSHDWQLKRVQRFLRWIRRKYKKLMGESIKYVWVREDRGVRPHYHLVCQQFPVEMQELARQWSCGRLDLGLLDNNPDYGWFARYLSKQEERAPGEKRWGQSRNLTEPVEQVKILKRKALAARPKAPKGYYVLSQYRQATSAGYEWEKLICIRLDRKQELPPDVLDSLSASPVWGWGEGEGEAV